MLLLVGCQRYVWWRKSDRGAITVTKGGNVMKDLSLMENLGQSMLDRGHTLGEIMDRLEYPNLFIEAGKLYLY